MCAASIQPVLTPLTRSGRGSRLVRTVCLLVAVLLAAGCSRAAEVPERYQDRGEEVRVITAVYQTGDPNAIEVEWAARPCETFDRTEVAYDGNRIDVTVHVLVDSFACNEVPDLSSTVVDLNGPLADREVWDDQLNDTQPILIQPAR